LTSVVPLGLCHTDTHLNPQEHKKQQQHCYTLRKEQGLSVSPIK